MQRGGRPTTAHHGAHAIVSRGVVLAAVVDMAR
jgi:hypothetical protein